MAVQQHPDKFDQASQITENRMTPVAFQPAKFVRVNKPATARLEEQRSPTMRRNSHIVKSILANAAKNPQGRKVLDNHHLYLETTRLDLDEVTEGASHQVFLSTAEKQIDLAPSTEYVWHTNGNGATPETVPSYRSLVVHDFPDDSVSKHDDLNGQDLRLEKIVRRNRLGVYLREKRRSLKHRRNSRSSRRRYRGR